ncbi:MAG: RsmE family RNA methyltransferase [Synergistaceae bacterium]|nr:RsmE family RNA methyltransferase [Synergistaceae bacterium]
MSLPRLRLENCHFDSAKNLWQISRDEAHHLVHVRRLYTGSLVEGLLCGASNDLTEKQGKKILLKLDCQGDNVFAREIKQEEEANEFELVLLLALLKSDQWEDALRFAAQTGVTHIAPLIAERSIPKITQEELPKKMLRWNKILDEATKQSSAVVPPHLAEPVSFINFDFDSLSGQRFVALLADSTVSLKDIKLGYSVALAIGPEGDWSPQEAKTLLENNFTPITLGKRILKASTAVAVGCGAISILKR